MATRNDITDPQPVLVYHLGEAVPIINEASLVDGTEVDGMPPASAKEGPPFGGPAESEQHRKLKDYILTHPKLIGAPTNPDRSETELRLLSGDEVDVFIARGDL
jgi:hypothetical protein